MKTAKKVLLFIMSLTIASMIVIISCKNRYMGPGDKGIFGEVEQNEEKESNTQIDNGNGLPAGYLTQEEQYKPMDPDSKKQVLFNGDYSIPALTVTAKKTILAAVGTGTTANHIAIKRSSDMGETWTEVKANYEGFSGIYTHPFFISGHDGSILLGIATTNTAKNETVIYKSSDDGVSWTKYGTNLSMSNLIPVTNTKNVVLTPDNSFVTYGNGVTLRHGTNKNTLIFPFYYQQKANSKGHCTATMISRNNGETWEQFGVDFGDFSSYETKFIELSDGSILINIRATGTGQTYWAKSTDCGETWIITTSGTVETSVNTGGKHADFTRYEFNGIDIKSGGEKYALSVIKKNVDGYNVRMTFNDFGDGKGNFGNKYLHNKDFATNSAKEDGYPAITVLPDGTIATLTEETDGIVFRRFNLSWISSVDGIEDGEDWVDYEVDNITK